MIKNQKQILEKLGIAKLNEMQEEAIYTIHANPETVLISPTGSGKTLAFVLPTISEININDNSVQAIIIAPSRELVMQIEQVIRDMGAGVKVNAVYGGQSFSKDKINLKHPPAILVGTPGRLADHLRRQTFSTEKVKFLILDEFDKSLEIGFSEEMSEIVAALPTIKKKILTSATSLKDYPEFLTLDAPQIIDYSDNQNRGLEIVKFTSQTKDKIPALLNLLPQLAGGRGIVFCNFKESIQRVSEALSEAGIWHGCYFGGLDQVDRDRALVKFRNGTHRLIIATDLAARGLDIPDLDFIIHYHLPPRKEEFIHRNGRTARMHAEGMAFVLQWKNEPLRDYLPELPEAKFTVEAKGEETDNWVTMMISGGRRDKISKGDIAGFLMKQGKLKNDQLGLIELKQECAFVAVKKEKFRQLIQLADNQRLKTKKVRLYVV